MAVSLPCLRRRLADLWTRSIAVTFLGPWRDLARNIWRVEFGMVAWALQNIPFFWQIVDRSFGIPGIIPLWVIHRDILRISDNL